MVEPAKTLFQTQFSSWKGGDLVPDAQIQRQLYQLMQQPREAPAQTDVTLPAELSLRCYVSHIIEQACIRLESQFGRQHGFTRSDIFPFVLDESPHLRSNHRRARTKPYRPLTQEIVHTFNPDQGNLTTWTTRLVRRHHGLNAVLLEYGVYLVSDWAILNDTSPQQLKRILAEFHTLSDPEIEQARCLLERYHAVYRRDRIQHRRNGSKGQCQAPTVNQLHQIAQQLMTATLTSETLPIPVEQILNQLKTLAEQLRQYRIYVRGGCVPSTSLDQSVGETDLLPQIATPCDEAAEVEQAEFLTAYHQQFQVSLDRAIAAVLRHRCHQLQRRQPQKVKQYLQALHLFHCQGQAMSEIAPQIDLKAQYQVSRLLQLKELRAAVRHQLLLELPDQVRAQAQIYTDPSRLESLDSQIDAALQAQVDQVLQVAASEASVPHNRPVHSLFAQRLCVVLDRRLDS